MENFYPRPPGGGRQIRHTAIGKPREISIHALRVEGDFIAIVVLFALEISIHALRVEGDCRVQNRICCGVRISIHALRVEGDLSGGNCSNLSGDFYPRPPGGGRPDKPGDVDTGELISIHALRVEGDRGASLCK